MVDFAIDFNKLKRHFFSNLEEVAQKLADYFHQINT